MQVFELFPRTKLNEANPNEMLIAFKRGGAALEWQVLYVYVYMCMYVCMCIPMYLRMYSCV